MERRNSGFRNNNNYGRSNFRGGGGGGGGFRPRSMHKAVCAECKQECEVPFRPTEGRPVYCRDCFMKQKDSGRPSGRFDRGSDDSRGSKDSSVSADSKAATSSEDSEDSEESKVSEGSEDEADSEEDSEK